MKFAWVLLLKAIGGAVSFLRSYRQDTKSYHQHIVSWEVYPYEFSIDFFMKEIQEVRMEPVQRPASALLSTSPTDDSSSVVH